jgi:hypothetical protein
VSINDALSTVGAPGFNWHAALGCKAGYQFLNIERR